MGNNGVTTVQALDMLKRMRRNGLAPDAIAYTKALTACELMGDATQAFALYHQAYDDGVVPIDDMHNVLVRVCSKAHRIDEALNLIKDLMRNHAKMEYQTLNSITRALCEDYIGASSTACHFSAFCKQQAPVYLRIARAMGLDGCATEPLLMRLQ
jgi:pentatricopeptide repeat protein